MPNALPITKAYVRPIKWDEQSGEPEEVGGDEEKFYVQFNPQSLKVNYANQKAGDGQPGSAPIQFVGKGTTTLAVELLFDVTVPQGQDAEAAGQPLKDVRVLTQRVAKYLEPKEGTEPGQYVPPGIRFGWDTFQFDGVVDSMEETLDFFSNTGKPLRATVAIQISKQEIKIVVPAGSPGTTAQHQVENGETLQRAAAAAGRDDWQNVGAANGIENPRRMEPGSLVDLSAGTGLAGRAPGGPTADSTGGVAAVSIAGANKLNVGVASALGFGASTRTGLASGQGPPAGPFTRIR